MTLIEQGVGTDENIRDKIQMVYRTELSFTNLLAQVLSNLITTGKEHTASSSIEALMMMPVLLTT